jgi:hypothetical protein
MQGVQVAFGAACVAFALPLILQLGPAQTVTNGTSVRVLGAALLSLAVGAFSAAKNPCPNRIVMRVEIVFTALTAVFLIFRLSTDHVAHDRAWLVLPPVVICLVLLLVLYPRSDGDPPPSQD